MDLDAIFRPQGVAILGASPNSGGARQIVEWLRALDYPGSIYPVNPKYEEFEGFACYPSPADLPEGVTTAAIVTGASSAVSLLDAAGAAGIKGAAIYAVGFREAGSEGLALEDELRSVAQQHSMAVVGPNCMGALAPAYRNSLYTGSVGNLDLLPGRTGLISQSGSVAIALLGLAGRVGGWSMVVSSGNETVCTAADYLEYMVEDEHTDRITLFVESIRSAAQFEKAARRAQEKGKPVIALKVGRSEGGKQNVKAHTGALAGSARVTSAFLRSCGVLEVGSFGEFVETIIAIAHPVRPQGRRIGAIHPSGGEASLLLDTAEPLGLEFPPLTDAGRGRLARDLHPWFAGSRNPLDAWGPIWYADAYEAGLDVLGEQSDIDLIVMLQDVAGSFKDAPSEVSLNVIELGRQTQRKHGKPVILLSNPHADIHPGVTDALKRAGIPGLVGTDAGLRAIKHWLDFHDRQNRTFDDDAPSRKMEIPTVALPGGAGSMNEVESKAIFRELGIAAPQEQLASSVEEALEAAERIGYPVVLKAVGRSLEHKTDQGLVHVGLGDADALRRVGEDVARRLEGATWDGFIVAEQIQGAREVLLGVTRDPIYGLTVLVGAGGVFTEAFDDVALGMPPISLRDAESMVSQLRSRRILSAWRGQEPADVEALYDVISRMGDLAVALGDRLESAEINPLAVLPAGQGVRALDALVVLR